MRLLQICEPPDGGAAAIATEMAIESARRGFDVEFAGPPTASGYERLEERGIRVHRLSLAPTYFNTRDDIEALGAIRRLLRRGDYDLVHLHSAKAGVLGRLAAARLRARVVYSPHSFPFVGELSRLRVAVATHLERRLAPLTDAILCVCDWERHLAIDRKIAPPERLRVIHNGCGPCPQSVAPDPQIERLRSGGPVAGAIAVLRPQKRLDLLIDAAPAILSAQPSARVVIVGNGPEQADLQKRAAALGLDRDTRFQMIPFEGSSWRYLAALDVFVLPSAWEAFPIGVLEALACGVPQVATDVGGTGEAVTQETGVLVPPRSPDALAKATVELLADPERREQMAVASRRRHEESFLAEKMVERTIGLYEELAGSRRNQASDAT